MANEFVLAGPKSDPAGTRGMALDDALRAISDKEASFITRGDASGTNLAEIAIWQSALGGQPQNAKWYRAAAVDMAAALQVASQTTAYTISDTATLSALQETGVIDIEILARDTPPLLNIYSVILADPQSALAKDFAGWLVSDEAKKIIAGFELMDSAAFFVYP